ncbi:MAG: RNA polymerase sigma factor [Psychroflexus halocasei]|uniref:RNA polymerase sigma factor n=1 Tax=Psychroflexus sp. S27 TaxID=1982757 RepID=UPI001EDCC78B|nr:sigma-70 region 4 domain-containing protein [Psychroflexus sp. S27]
MPEGYRTVFVLHVIEQYPHQSIADLLNISVGTSKSQFYKAKKMLKEKMNHSQNRFL